MGVAITEDDRRVGAVTAVNKAAEDLVHARNRLHHAIKRRDAVLHEHESEIGTAKHEIAKAEEAYRAARRKLLELVPDLEDPSE